ncbi:hypothetical protein EJB05_05735, partial [Eragrostis curvula]
PKTQAPGRRPAHRVSVLAPFGRCPLSLRRLHSRTPGGRAPFLQIPKAWCFPSKSGNSPRTPPPPPRTAEGEEAASGIGKACERFLPAVPRNRSRFLLPLPRAACHLTGGSTGASTARRASLREGRSEATW